MYLTKRIRLLPTAEQEKLFWKSAGVARWSYNFFLSYNQEKYNEYLKVSGMMKNKNLAKSIADSKWYEFRRQILYKAELYNIEVVLANRFYPSSKTCSCCGNYKKDLKLKDRTYICYECGLIIDRDINAAINLANYQNLE